jgi:gas vesicle protein
MHESKDVTVNGCSRGAVAFAFMAGAVIGAGAVLLLTPEGGLAVRRRLLRGVETAQEELADIITETREALEVLTKDARQTVKRTASRLKAAVDATSEAMKASVEDGDAR